MNAATPFNDQVTMTDLAASLVANMDPEQKLCEVHADMHLQPAAFHIFKALVEQHACNGLGPQWRVAIAQGLPSVFLANVVLSFMHCFGDKLWPSGPQKRGHLTPWSRKSRKGFWMWNVKTAGYEGPILLVDGRAVETRIIPYPRESTCFDECVRARSRGYWLTKASFCYLAGSLQTRLRSRKPWAETEASHYCAWAALARTFSGGGSEIHITCRRGKGTPCGGREAP